jgi:hypothetical protein
MTSSRTMSVVGGYPLQGLNLRHYDAFFYRRGVAEAAQHGSRYASALTAAGGRRLSVLLGLLVLLGLDLLLLLLDGLRLLNCWGRRRC